MLWLWCGLVATAPIRPLAWEPPYATGAALEKTKNKKQNFFQLPDFKITILIMSQEIKDKIYNFSRKLETIKKNKIKAPKLKKDYTTETKNLIDEFTETQAK